MAHLVYTSTYNVVFGGQVIRNGDETAIFTSRKGNYSTIYLLSPELSLKNSHIHILVHLV